VTGICNSTTQKAFIEEKCVELQLQNVDIIVADISTFEMEASYDRIFSIEMFEHMKNYKDLLNKISKWMKEDGLLFDDVTVVNHWLVNGKHYTQTSEEWLKRMDKNMTSIKPIMESTYGKDSATKWTVFWRTFFIAVAELFGYNNGEEWMVSMAVDDRAVFILSLISKFSATKTVWEEMLKVGTVSKLFVLLQADHAKFLKVMEIFNAHSEVWKNSP
ncbi:hypothetical protein RYX36_018451, partial [Vicia faba]